MKKVTYMGNREVEVTYYVLYVNTQKGKKQKWAGECDERIEIDNRLKRYFENNDYVSATVVCKHKDGHYLEHIRYTK